MKYKMKYITDINRNTFNNPFTTEGKEPSTHDSNFLIIEANVSECSTSIFNAIAK
jgi:hypothetical protein